MAWDVIILHVCGKVPPINELTEETCLPLGTPNHMRERISERFPATDWSNSTHGHFVSEDQAFTIEFKINAKEPLRTVFMTIRGGQEAIPAITQFAKSNGWQLFDCSGGWLDLDDPSAEGWSGEDRLRRAHEASVRDDEHSKHLMVGITEFPRLH